ncbi:GGDEF domain-containing protein [Massilia sp. B-10]|nr:GGDEF domain-containing protein [Massilia sp. B-10]
MLDEALGEARKREHAVYVLMMDLDRFKHVNDVLGHNFGDDLLRQVAERLRLRMAQVHPSAQLARLGGDEFAVLLPDCSVEAAQRIAAGILEALEVPLSLEDQTVDIGGRPRDHRYPAVGMRAPRNCCRWPKWRCTRPSSATTAPSSTTRQWTPPAPRAWAC